MGRHDGVGGSVADGHDPGLHKADDASAHDKLVNRVLTFGETVGTLTKNGLPDAALIKDCLWVEGMWAKVSPAVEKIRSELGEPRLYENFELLTAK